MKNYKLIIRIFKIVEHISSVAFICLMLFLWRIINDSNTFAVICIPSIIIYGSFQGNSTLVVRILEEIIEELPNARDGSAS